MGDVTRNDYSRQREGPITRIVQGVAAGIGLAEESYHHHKEKKAQEQDSSQGQDTGNRSLGTRESVQTVTQQIHQATWDLDDAQDTVENPRSSTTETADPTKLAAQFINEHPPPEPPIAGSNLASPLPRLAHPVVLTQRRPKARDRGFIRAYAPLLSDVGIEQEVFLEFVDKLNKVVEPTPWLNAINLASLAGLAVPTPFTVLISIATRMAVKAAMEVNSRSKGNSYLDKLNAGFFQPRGLICLIMTWKPESASTPMTNVDFEGRALTDTNTGTFGKLTHNLQSSSGVDSFEWPDTAPLIFPGVDDMAVTPGDKRDSMFKRSSNFVRDYMDRRAQAEWAGQNPDSKMANAAPKPEFHSQYADPNTVASSGDILALLTGGYLHMPMRNIRHERRRQVRALRGAAREERDEQGMSLRPLSLLSGVRKVLQKDILYLMIVNIPSEQEMAQATEIIARYNLDSQGGPPMYAS